MLPSHPRPSSFSFSFLVEPGTRYETYWWLAHDGEANASVSYWRPGCPFTIQGPPAGLRELAAALLAAAEQVEPVVAFHAPAGTAARLVPGRRSEPFDDRPAG